MVMNIVSHRKIFYAISGMLALASIIALAVFGLRFGIDFTGGAILEAEFLEARPEVELLRSRVDATGFSGMQLTPIGDRGVLVRGRHISEEMRKGLMSSLAGEAELLEKRFDSVGPTIGNELKRRSIVAVLIVLVLIVVYIAWAFRKVSRPVSSWKYGVVAVAALTHDVLIPSGLFALLGKTNGVEIDALFVTALLTILGFSVHDTIVVFDRIRENLASDLRREAFGETVARSLSETITRSVNTSVTVLLALSSVFFFGGATVKFFSLALIVGVFFGTYSSIFIAGPLLVSWRLFSENREVRRMKARMAAGKHR